MEVEESERKQRERERQVISLLLSSLVLTHGSVFLLLLFIGWSLTHICWCFG